MYFTLPTCWECRFDFWGCRILDIFGPRFLPALSTACSGPDLPSLPKSYIMLPVNRMTRNRLLRQPETRKRHLRAETARRLKIALHKSQIKLFLQKSWQRRNSPDQKPRNIKKKHVLAESALTPLFSNPGTLGSLHWPHARCRSTTEGLWHCVLQESLVSTCNWTFGV